MKLFLAAALILSMPYAEASDMYRWVDKNGKVQYGDIPTVDDAEQLKFREGESAASGVEDANIPFGARMAAHHFPVTLYVTESCGDTCKQARNYLAKRHIPFTENVLKSAEEYEAFQKKSGSEGVPALSVGNSWLKGFSTQQWQDELDAAGYPK